MSAAVIVVAGASVVMVVRVSAWIPAVELDAVVSGSVSCSKARDICVTVVIVALFCVSLSVGRVCIGIEVVTGAVSCPNWVEIWVTTSVFSGSEVAIFVYRVDDVML